MVPLFLALVLLASSCGGSQESVAARSTPEPAPRQLGSWKGQGSTTLGFVSESGSFRIHWKTESHDDARPGTFELTLRSGISGRSMKVIADQRGTGGGTVEFGDDPRMYEFIVESTAVDWTISVEETFAPRR
jgi:hypothetical protein